jgi:tRNA threonylcarbamoyladenosine biosynthesis protein TsaB
VRILALDTATENCSAALLIDGHMATRELELERGHAERILPMIDELLAEAGTTLRDLDAIAFGRGPGSFTGVRLAATVTQGLAFGAGVGVVPISDLRAVAQRAFDHETTIAHVLVCNDARMGEVYWGCFERGVDGLATPKGNEHVGKPLSVDDLRAAVPSVVTGDYGRYLPRAAEIMVLAVPEVTGGRLVSAEAAIPVYLRDNVAHVAQPKKPAG